MKRVHGIMLTPLNTRNSEMQYNQLIERTWPANQYSPWQPRRVPRNASKDTLYAPTFGQWQNLPPYDTRCLPDFSAGISLHSLEVRKPLFVFRDIERGTGPPAIYAAA